MTIKDLKELIELIPDDSEIKILSQGLSYAVGHQVDTELEAVGFDDTHYVTYFEIGDLDISSEDIE